MTIYESASEMEREVKRLNQRWWRAQQDRLRERRERWRSGSTR